MCQSDCENDLLFLLMMERPLVMHPTNKLNKSSVQLGAWVWSAGGLFFSPSWQAALRCHVAPSSSTNHLVSGSSDFMPPAT